MTAVAGTPRATPARCSSVGALLLEPAATDHLGLDVGEAGEHRLGVALADRGALRQHQLEQVARRVDLRVQMDEQLGLEDGAHDDCISL